LVKIGNEYKNRSYPMVQYYGVQHNAIGNSSQIYRFNYSGNLVVYMLDIGPIFMAKYPI